MMDSKTLTIKLVPDPSDDIGARVIVLKPGTRRVTVGRSSKVDFKKLHPAADNAFFDSRVMSRNHVEFISIPKNQEVYVSDTNSMHGTLLNGVKLSTGGKQLIKSADMLTFGAQVCRGNDYYKPLSAVVELKWHEEKPSRPRAPPRPKEILFAPAKEPVKPSEPQPAPRSKNTFVVPDNDDSDDDDDDGVEIVEPPTQKEYTTWEEVQEEVEEEGVEEEGAEEERVGKEGAEEERVGEEDEEIDEESESESGSQSESEEDEMESKGPKEDKKDTTMEDREVSDSDSSVGDLLENHSSACSSPNDHEVPLDDDKELSLKKATDPVAPILPGVSDDTVLPDDANVKKFDHFVNEAESKSRSVPAIEERGETRKEQDTGSRESIKPRDLVNGISVDAPTGISNVPQKPSGPENAPVLGNSMSLPPDASAINSATHHPGLPREIPGCGLRPPPRPSQNRRRSCILGEDPDHHNMRPKCPPMQRKYIPNNYGPPPPSSFSPQALPRDPYTEGPFSVDFTTDFTELGFDFPSPHCGKEGSFPPGLGVPPRGFGGGDLEQTSQSSFHNSCPPPSGGYPNISAPRELTDESLNARLGRLVARMNEDNTTRNRSQEPKTTALSVSRSDPRTILQETGDSSVKNSLKRTRDYISSGSAHEDAGTKAAPAPLAATNDMNLANTGVQTTTAASIEKNMLESSENRDEDEPRRKRARTSSEGSNITRYAVSALAGAVVGSVGVVMGLAALPAGFFE